MFLSLVGGFTIWAILDKPEYGFVIFAIGMVIAGLLNEVDDRRGNKRG